MSIKKAQSIVNQVEKELGIVLTAYSNQELEHLKYTLEEFLELEVETEELSDPDSFYENEDLEDDLDGEEQ